ncbi:MAG TPA: LytTR family DNA-binding domain-containing protein [Blastocatellia bacterium]|nr:LytTR family DNA-binding domain-containing protein [Blastocatellia bacterium]
MARERIREMLRADPQIEVIGDCSNGDDAIEAVKTFRPDILLLDIQMPGTDGFGVLEALDPQDIPCVIFITAYDQYAVKAFEVYALDYLLKPFDRERFTRAIERGKQHVLKERNSSLNDRVLAVLNEIKNKPEYLERLVIRTNGHIFFIKTEEIDWLEAEGNYVRLHSGKESYLLRDAISSLENQLDPKRFLRIHRSAIVNINRIQELQPWFHGEYRVILQDGVQLTLSRSYRDKLNELVGKSL